MKGNTDLWQDKRNSFYTDTSLPTKKQSTLLTNYLWCASDVADDYQFHEE